MESKVSGFLKEVMAPEIQAAFMAPVLFRSFAPALPLMSAINKAHVVMLEEQGILDQAVAAELARVILDLDEEGPSAFELDPAREDPYFNYEAEVIRRVGADVGGRMHVARSRNDLKATQDRMRARHLAIKIMSEVQEVRRVLIDQAGKYSDVVMPGYTHLQPAQPITYGWYLLGVESGLQRDFNRFSEAYSRLNLSPLGAGALAGTSFPINRDRTACLLGFDGPAWHAQDAIACRDVIIELVAACTFLATTMGRMAQDFYNMTTYEFSTLDLPDSVAITSSIMPQKKNMAALENLKGRPAHLIGALSSAFAAYKAVPYSHAQDGTSDSMRWVWDSLEEMALAVPAARVVVSGAKPKPERMLELVRENYSTATDLADALVREKGLSFREAHHVVGRVVRLAMERGLKADEVGADLIDQAAVETIGRAASMSDEAARNALDPVKAVLSREGTGGPSPNDVAALVEAANSKHAEDSELLSRRVASLRAAEGELEKETKRLSGLASAA